MPTPTPRRQPQPAPLPSGSPRHSRAVTPARPDDSGGTSGTASSSRAPSQTVRQQRLQGAFLTIIGLAGLIGGVMFSIEAPRFTPVPVVFLTFWLVMVIVGKILFAGLGKLRDTGVGAPAPTQVRAAAAVAGIVVAVGMMGFAATTAGTGTAIAAPCPGGGPATCGPTGPELTFTPPPAQTGTPGGQQGGQQGGQDNNGIATSPAGSGGDNGPGIQAQTPQFGTPGQQAPNIPGNEQPGQGSGQQPQGNGQQNQNPAVQTTAPGGPQQTGQQQPGQQTQSGQPSSPTVTVTKTESQCAVPGTGNGAGTPSGPGGEDSSNNSGGTGPDNGDSENQDGAPSWAYLAGEASALMTGRRRPGSGSSQGPSPTDVGEVPAAAATDAGQPDAAPAPEQLAASEPMETQPGSETVDELTESTGTDTGGTSNAGEGENDDDTEDTSSPFVNRSADDITKEYDDDQQVLHTSLEERTAILRGTPLLTQPGPYTPQQEADRTVAAQAAQQQAATARLTGPMQDAIAQAQGTANPVRPPLDTTGSRQSPDPLAPLKPVLAQVQNPDAPTDPMALVLQNVDPSENEGRDVELDAAWDKFINPDLSSKLREFFVEGIYPVSTSTGGHPGKTYQVITMSDGSKIRITNTYTPQAGTIDIAYQLENSPIFGNIDINPATGAFSRTLTGPEEIARDIDMISTVAMIFPAANLGSAAGKAAAKLIESRMMAAAVTKFAEGATAAQVIQAAQAAARNEAVTLAQTGRGAELGLSQFGARMMGDTRVAAKIPESWATKPAQKKGGIRFSGKGNDGVRIDKGVPGHILASQRVDHVVVNSRGRMLDANGNPIAGANPSKTAEVHIPLDVWLKWRSWDHP